MSKLAESFGAMIFGFILGVGFSIYNAWLFKDVFNWFIASTFGLPQIGTALAMGILIVVSWPRVGAVTAMVRAVGGASDEEHPLAASIGFQIVIAMVHTISWVVGYILVKNFI